MFQKWRVPEPRDRWYLLSLLVRDALRFQVEHVVLLGLLASPRSATYICTDVPFKNIAPPPPCQKVLAFFTAFLHNTVLIHRLPNMDF